MKLTFDEKDAIKSVLYAFEACVQHDENQPEYSENRWVDAGDFVLGMSEKTYKNFVSGFNKFRKFTISDVKAYDKRQQNCEHTYTFLDNNKVCLKCGKESYL